MPEWKINGEIKDRKLLSWSKINKQGSEHKEENQKASWAETCSDEDELLSHSCLGLSDLYRILHLCEQRT